MTTLQQFYLAVVPPPDVVETIDRLPTKAQRGIRYTKRDRWHITVKFVGDCNPNEAVAALSELEASATDVTLGPTVSLLGNRVLIVPASGLDDLAAATAAAFEGVGEAQPDREFSGHVTLARLKGAPLRDPSIISVLDAPIAATFRAATVALFANEISAEGTTRTMVAEMPLAD